LLIGHDIADDRSTDVHCHFESYEHELIPGTYMNAEIAVTNAKSSVLPDEAILLYENKQYVFIKSGTNQFQMTEVQIGSAQHGYTEILNTEKISNNEYVIKGAYSLLMSLKNKVDQ